MPYSLPSLFPHLTSPLLPCTLSPLHASISLNHTHRQLPKKPPNMLAGNPHFSSSTTSGDFSAAAADIRPSRYESQKRRDWNTFSQYLRNHRPPLALSRCSGAHVLEFLRYLDQFGKTKVHASCCPFFGQPCPPAPCSCPLRQAWGSLDALVGRLRAAFEENGGEPEANPFGVRAVRLYLREVRDSQAKARGIAYEKKKRRRSPANVAVAPAAEGGGVEGEDVRMMVADGREQMVMAGLDYSGGLIPL